MKTRSIRRLHQILLMHWEDHNQIELTRTGVSAFQVGVPGSNVAGFVFGKGWSESSSPIAVTNTQVLIPRRLKLATTFAMLFAVVLCVIAGAGLVSAHVTGKAESASLSLKPVTDAPSKGRQSTSSSQNQCTLSQAPARPIGIDSVAEGALKLSLIRDVTIGGERQQLVGLSCERSAASQDPNRNSGMTIYAIRYWLDGNTWKAKSATPLGSHSRY